MPLLHITIRRCNHSIAGDGIGCTEPAPVHRWGADRHPGATVVTVNAKPEGRFCLPFCLVPSRWKMPGQQDVEVRLGEFSLFDPGSLASR